MIAKKRRLLLGKYVRPVLLLADWAIVNLIFGFTLYLYPAVCQGSTPQWLLWLLVNLSFVPVAIRETRMESSVFRSMQFDRAMLHVLVSTGLHMLFFLAFTALLDIRPLGIEVYACYYSLLLLALELWSLLSRWYIKSYHRRGMNFTRVVIVGTNTTARRLYESMQNDPGFGYKVLGFFDHEWRPDFAGRYCGNIEDLGRFVRDNSVDQIYFTMPGHDDILTRVVKIADDNVVEFFYVPQISRYIARDFQIQNIGPVPVLTIRRNPLRKPINRIVKRTFDIVVSSLFLCFYPLVYIPIAIAIKLTSPGPVYFCQQRTGYKGKPFGCLKFRTMRVNNDADKAQATKNDPRKTRLGEFLRHSSLDELPQFINVLKGNMSIVGPRPHMLRHTEEYSKIVDQYMVRHLVKPGITGWAQVNGYRGLTDELWKMEKRVEFDVWYIEHWNILLDIKIMARTVVNAVKGEKNAF